MRRFGLFLLFLALACSRTPAPPGPTPAAAVSLVTAPPTAPVTAMLPTATAAPSSTPPPSLTPWPPDTGWAMLQPGLERRWLQLYDEAGQLIERVYLLRLEPAAFRFAVGYRPGAPLPLADWQSLTGALIVVNGGYFTEAFVATGLIVADGQASGQSYGEFAGMLALTPAGPEVRWLQQRPYDPAEPLLGAVQSFPVLVQPGGIAGYPEEDGQRARRTVVAQDRGGRILFIVTPLGHFTLFELSQFLASGDLDLDIAVNLDGGASSGILLAEPAENLPAFSRLPAVIAVHPRP